MKTGIVKMVCQDIGCRCWMLFNVFVGGQFGFKRGFNQYSLISISLWGIVVKGFWAGLY